MSFHPFSRRGPLRRRLSFIALAFLAYMLGATFLEKRSIGGQAPRVAAAGVRRVSREVLLSDLKALSSIDMEGRKTGTAGGLKARAYVVERFRAIGLKPAAAGYVQPFSFLHTSIRGLFLPGRPFRTSYRDAANVLGTVPGSAPQADTLVISAHYDHLGRRGGDLYPGADDNASGVSALLSAATFFAANPPAHPMLFASFDAEELGLRGSKTFVASRPAGLSHIALNINLDMVSRNPDNEIFASGTWKEPALRRVLTDVQKAAEVKILFGHDRPMWRAGFVENWTTQSDHGSFHEAGIPFLYFGVADHDDYHRPTDTPERIDPVFFGNVADMVVEALVQLDRRIPARGGLAGSL